MTTFEFFKAQLDEAVEKGLTNRINPEIKPGSSKWVQVLKVMEYSNWKARQLGQTRKIALTNKGLREFYKVMIKR